VTVVFDLEVEWFPEERGIDEQEVAVAGLVDADRGGGFEFFLEPDVPRFVQRLEGADEVVGHNIRDFDYAVLDNYVGLPKVETRLGDKTVDTLARNEERHGRRISLDQLADATLARRKDVTEVGVPELWRTGQTTAVVDRLRSDVILNRDVFRHGRDFGWVVARRAARRKDSWALVQLEVDW
jgi:hypothetical protein